jgi:hypothetical protein
LIVEALTDTRIVFVAGARQVGKTTLGRSIISDEHPMESFTLDNQAVRDAAQNDPTGFVAGLPGPALIDEIQRAPDLVLAIKDDVDTDTTPGRYLLTGSANLLASKRVKDALTGRVETIRLWPLAQTEIEGGELNFVDALRAARPPQVTDATVGRPAFVERVAAGGYPEALRRKGDRRDRWFENYLDTTLTRDFEEISGAHKVEEVPRLLRLLSAQAANVLSYLPVAEKMGLHHDTVKNYVDVLEQMFIVVRLQAWRPGLGNREATKPKFYVADSGLLCYLLGADETRIAEDDQVTGKALENFVAMEVLRHAGWAERRARLYHYQRDKEDIDLVLEWADGTVAGIEVKASATVDTSDAKWLIKLRENRGDKFRAGVVIYTGEQTTPLGDRLWAVPISGLWA